MTKLTDKKESASVAAAKARGRSRIPLRITDTTLRDAHQSLWATRMRTKDIMGIIDVIDDAGYYSLEVWGGATFDVCLRFLRENPWERLRQIKARARKTPLQMLLRGQNILGYRNYPDDVLDRFVALACENGIDIFRIFDALNDTRNLEHAIKSVKKHGGHAQGTICYTISPVHTVREYVRIAREQVQMGVDSLAIKDMAGILSPIAAEKLVSALVREVDLPIQLHCHTTSGMATATYVEGVRAGAGAIDCAISVMSGYSSQPPVETMLAIFDETSYHANLDVEALRKICKYFQNLAPKRVPGSHPTNVIDPEILVHHIPGGMISNLRSQLEEQKALNRLDEVLAELPRARADLGYPPLVTPTSQIIGVQAVLNVLAGERYSMVTQETKDYVRGLYGRSPAPIKPSVQKKILGGEKVITGRPADLLEPLLPTVTADIEPGMIKAEEDIISYCLFPEIALDYFRWRNTPEEKQTAIPADLEEQKRGAGEKKPELAVAPLLSVNDYAEIRNLVEKVNQLGLTEVTVRRNDVCLSVKGSGMEVGRSAETPPVASAPPPTGTVRSPARRMPSRKSLPSRRQRQPAAPVAPPAGAPKGPTIDAPLNGTVYFSTGPGKPLLVKEGDTVKEGVPVCIVEAMKLFNQIKAPRNCRIVKILVEHGKPVEKGQPLVSIEPV
jgi:oxaloacetate decarboxylase (Na+ extruding) subunit alpha